MLREISAPHKPSFPPTALRLRVRLLREQSLPGWRGQLWVLLSPIVCSLSLLCPLLDGAFLVLEICSCVCVRVVVLLFSFCMSHAWRHVCAEDSLWGSWALHLWGVLRVLEDSHHDRVCPSVLCVWRASLQRFTLTQEVSLSCMFWIVCCFIIRPSITVVGLTDMAELVKFIIIKDILSQGK